MSSASRTAPAAAGRSRSRAATSCIEADTIIGAIGQSTNTQFLYNDLPVG